MFKKNKGLIAALLLLLIFIVPGIIYCPLSISEIIEFLRNEK